MSKCECRDCIHYEVCEYKGDMLCDYFKDKSLFVELPCKVGDTVWEVYAKGSEYTKIEQGVHSLKVDLIYINNDIIIHCVNENSSAHMVLSDFGKTVFLTKEEAEKEIERNAKNN